MLMRMLSVLPKTRVLSRSYATSFNFHEMVQGNRDQVGWGSNGLPYYFDCPLVPFPAVRYKLNTPEVLALREKEKGDWCKLSMDEKTQLYRNSFRHSYAEILAPKGKWGLVFGCVFLFMSTVFWVYLIVRLGINGYPQPHTLTLEGRQALVKRFLNEEKDPIFGISSKWDYENKKWKD